MYIMGDVGEVITASALREVGLLVLRNLYLKHKDAYTEIDIVAISCKGVFVVENKNYSGVVHGSVKKRYWNNGDMYNPVMQNSVHVNAVKGVLKCGCYIYNVVIFNDKIKKLVCDDSSRVFTLSGFIEAYKNFDKIVFTDDEVEEIYNKLKVFSDSSLEARLNHLRKGGML